MAITLLLSVTIAGAQIKNATTENGKNIRKLWDV